MNKNTLKMINPSEITIEDNYNARLDFEKTDAFKELKASIKEHGVREALTAVEKDGKILLRAGHRRLTAVLQLIKSGVDFKSVAVIVKAGMTQADSLIDLITSNSGEDLNLIEQGAVFHRMETKLGWKRKEIALQCSKTQAHIGNAIKLVEYTPEIVRDAIAAGKIACSLVLEMIVKFKTDERIIASFEKAVERAAAEDPSRKKLTRKDIRFPVIKSKDSANSASNPQPKKDLKMLEVMQPEAKNLLGAALNDLVTDHCHEGTDGEKVELMWELNRFSRELLDRIPVVGEQTDADAEPTAEQLAQNEDEDSTQGTQNELAGIEAELETA